jgi:hypothetical protein
MNPTRSYKRHSYSATGLAKIRCSSKISSWKWLIISGMVTVLGHPEQGALQLKYHRVYTGTPSFWRWNKIVYVPLMFLSEWHGFLPTTCLRGKILEDSSRLDVVKITPIAKYASFQHLLQGKRCNSAHEQTPVNNDTIDCVLRLRE